MEKNAKMEKNVMLEVKGATYRAYVTICANGAQVVSTSVRLYRLSDGAVCDPVASIVAHGANGGGVRCTTDGVTLPLAAWAIVLDNVRAIVGGWAIEDVVNLCASVQDLVRAI